MSFAHQFPFSSASALIGAPMKFAKTVLLFLPLALAVSWAVSQPPPWQRGPGGGPGPRPARPVRERPDGLKVDMKEPPAGLVKNPRFRRKAPDGRSPAGYKLQGDVAWTWCGKEGEFTDPGVKLVSGKDLDGDGTRAGTVSQTVTGFERGAGRWFRFSIRGLAEMGFQVENKASDLFMRVEFFGSGGTNSFDCVTQELYPLVELNRKDMAANGDYFKNGGAVWKTYSLDFRLPFNEIDTLALVVGFKNGAAASERDSKFYVSDFSLVPIPPPADAPKVVTTEKGPAPSLMSLLSLGGRWFYQSEDGIARRPATLVVNAKNAARLYYMDGQLSNPFAQNMTAWLRKGYLDLKGQPVAKDQFVPDNVVLEFKNGKDLVVHSRNLPNHPTSKFPDPYGNGNPNSIQEVDRTYYLPLAPVRDPAARAMDQTNSNRALPMGSIGVAINGVMFFNPFDAGNMEAVNIMDRCCGHPSPGNEYHYHKYPVCIKSPFSLLGPRAGPLALDRFRAGRLSDLRSLRGEGPDGQGRQGTRPGRLQHAQGRRARLALSRDARQVPVHHRRLCRRGRPAEPPPRAARVAESRRVTWFS
jgi:hypothetical protein